MSIQKIQSTAAVAKPTLEHDFPSNANGLINAPKQGLALHEAFKDELDTKAYTSSGSQLNHMNSRSNYWMSNPQVAANDISVSTKELEELTRKPLKPIQALPTLETPTQIANNVELEKALAELAAAKKKNKQSLIETQEILGSLNTHTIEQIYLILTLNDLNIKKETANLEKSSAQIDEKVKIAHQKFMDELKELIAKDQAKLGKFTTAQQVAGVALAVCSIFTICVATGVAGPGGFVAALGTFGTPITALFSSLSTAGKAYAEHQMDQNNAQMTLTNQTNKEMSQRSTNRQERIGDLLESNQLSKDNLFKKLKEMRRLFTQMMDS